MNWRFIVLSVMGLLPSPVEAERPWQRHVIDNSSVGADGVRLADFNRDGKLDVVTGWEQGGVTRIYLQPQSNHIRSPWPAVTVGPTPSVEDAVAVDLDNDGYLDVVSSTEGKTQTLFVHWSPNNRDDLLDSSKWQTKVIPDSVHAQSWMFCLPMQVDGRRGIDLVTGSKGQHAAVGWWESPEDPRNLNEWKYHRLIDAGWIMSLIPLDVDLDGDLDIGVTDRKGVARGVKWLELDDRDRPASAAAWKTHVIGDLDKEVMFASVGDVDQDGTKDIVVMTWNGTIDLFHRVPGKQRPQWKLQQISHPFGYAHGKSVAIADLNQNGRVDLAVTLRSVPRDAPAVVLLETGGPNADSRWQATDIGGPEGSKFDLIEAIDIDHDGDLDLLTCEEVFNLGVVWYENPLVDSQTLRTQQRNPR